MKNPTIRFIITMFIVSDIFLWYRILGVPRVTSSAMHFLNIGQGDSELLELPGPVSLMTDAGPDGSVVSEMDAVSKTRRRIDLAVVTHPQADHFNGFNYLLGRYSIGAILLNGRNDDPGVAEWVMLLRKAKEFGVAVITVTGGDRIRIGSSTVTFLSPDAGDLQSAELNDTGLVEYVKTPQFSALLTADIGFGVEKQLVTRGGIRADILKVGHHGSKYSSSPEFLSAVNPAISIIEVGKKNRYGHPASVTLKRLSEVSQNIFRTDINGRVSVIPNNGKLEVYAQNANEE
jgi:competence protein ComEC